MITISLLDSVSEIIDNRGKTCPTSEHGIPLIATNCVKSSNLYPTKEKIRFVNQDTYNTWFKGHPQPRDILFVNKGSPGEVCLVPEDIDFCFAQDMVALRANKEKIDPLYLFAVLRSKKIKGMIQNMHVGTMIPHFKKKDFDNIHLPLPHKRIQEFIGNFYYSCSKKIHLNQKINKTLDKVAKTLFKSWFIDFDPVRAKIDGRSIGISKEISDLFPDSFEDSKLGKIPKGWKITNLSKQLNVFIGGDWGKGEPKEDYDQKVLCIRGADIPSIQNFIHTKLPRRFIKSSSLKKRNLREGDLVLEISGGSPTQSTGRVIYISKEFLDTQNLPVVSSNFCRILQPGNKIVSNFLYHFIRYLYNRDELFIYETGTTGIKNFNYKYFSQERFFIIPENNLLKEFFQITNSFFQKQGTILKENTVLTQTRDMLLPKLISGKLKISDAEKFIDEASI